MRRILILQLMALAAIATPMLIHLSSAAQMDSQMDGVPASYDIGDGPTSIAVVDLNGDQRAEIVVINRHTNSFSVLMNNGSGAFALKSKNATGLLPIAIASGDFNKDGKPDIVVANSGSDTVSVFLGKGDGNLTRRADYHTGAVPCAVAIGDLNRDRNLDLVVVNRYGNSVSVLLGHGDATFSAKTDYSTGRLPNSIAVSDVEPDGRPDLLVTSCFDRNVSLLSGNGDGTFRPATRYARARTSCGFVVGALDGDARPVLVEPHRYGYLISIQLGRDGDRPAARRDYLAGKGPRSVVADDFNGDGVADMAVANAGHLPGESGSVFILLGKRNGGFEPKNSYVTGSASYSIAAGDLNGDGKLDLIVLNSSYDFGGTVSLLFGNGDGTFGGRLDCPTGGYLIWVSFGEDASGKSSRDVVWPGKPPEK